MNKYIKYIKHPTELVLRLGSRGLLPFLADEAYIKMKFRYKMGYSLNLDNPQTFNEKLQWLKLHNHKDIYTTMVDKYEAKNYVANIIGEKYIIPTLGVWNTFDDIDFSKLPKKFVLKCTHNSGRVVICKDKSFFDYSGAKKTLNKALMENFYLSGREWPYKNVKPRIIAEKYMEDESGYELKDYKVFNFGGEPHIIQVDFDRFKGHKKNLYTTDWDFIEASINFPNEPNRIIERPKALNQMLDLARVLVKDIPFVRTDFYSIDNRLYFGEITFYPGSGYMTFSPEEFDRQLGDLIPLNRGGYLIKGNGYIITIKENVRPNVKPVPIRSDDVTGTQDKETGLVDYKIHCFMGIPKVILVCKDRFLDAGMTEDFFDIDWNHLNVKREKHGNSKRSILRPIELDEMLSLSKKLSVDIPFLRIDFYIIDHRVYFGEMTFYPASGFEAFEPESFDREIGSWLTLNQ